MGNKKRWLLELDGACESCPAKREVISVVLVALAECESECTTHRIWEESKTVNCAAMFVYLPVSEQVLREATDSQARQPALGGLDLEQRVRRSESQEGITNFKGKSA